MNVLPFVFALLMVMGIMTYAKLGTFIVSNRLQSQYLCYMKAVSAAEFNLIQLGLYKKDQTKRGSNNNPDNQVNAISKINIYPLLHLTQDAKDPKYANTQRILLKRLIYNSYGKQPFFKEMEKSNQDILEYLLDKISAAAQLPENKNKIERLENLSNIDLENEKLQMLFATLLHGSQNSAAALKKCDPNAKDTEAIISYPPLKDFVSLEKTSKPIRVYLVPPEILWAIFDNVSVVKEIIDQRAILRREFKKELKANFTTRFTQMFQSKLPPDLDPAYFNFEVTSTKPHNKWTSS